MSLYIIVPDDAKRLANKLRTSLQSSVDYIHAISADEFLRLEFTQKDTSVRVILLTKLLWQEIQGRPKEDVCNMFSKPKDTIVIISCDESIKKEAIHFFSKMVHCSESIGFFTASGEDWFKAEAKIRYRLAQNENKEVHIPHASRYVIKPDSVTKLSNSMSEVLIIILVDGTKELSDVSRLVIKVGENKLKAKKITSNVWSFNANDLIPGDHEIRVVADDVDLGPNTLHIQDKHTVIKELLTDLKKQDPKRFLAELLNIDKDDFDRDLVDKICDSSCVSLVETLLTYGEDKDCEYPNFMHFCAKHGLEANASWCAREMTNFKEKCSVPNNLGKLPHQVAEETNQTRKLITILEIQEDLQAIKSPFKKVPRNSGMLTEGTGDSQDPTYTKPKNDKHKRFQFTRRSREYSTIDDDDNGDGDSAYNRAWDKKTILPNRQAQALSDTTLIGEIIEESYM